MDLQDIKNKIFLDNTRLPPNNDWVVVRNISQFLEAVSNTKKPFIVSFDYDLGNQILPDIVEITYYNGEISNYCLSVFNENEKTE